MDDPDDSVHSHRRDRNCPDFSFHDGHAHSWPRGKRPDAASNNETFWSVADVVSGGASRDRCAHGDWGAGARTGDRFVLVEDVPDCRGNTRRSDLSEEYAKK